MEITRLPEGVAVRHSMNPGFPALRYTADERAAFCQDIAGGTL